MSRLSTLGNYLAGLENPGTKNHILCIGTPATFPVPPCKGVETETAQRDQRSPPTEVSTSQAPNENAARRTGGAIVIPFPTSRRGPMFGDREPAATTSRHHMAAEAAKFKTSSDPSVDPNPELHDLWIELRKAVSHFSAAGDYAADGHDEIARHAALEGVTTLRLGFSQWMGCPEYRKFAKDARAACGNRQPFEMPALLDDGIKRTCDSCAVEINACTIISPKVREDLEEALREVASAGASAAPSLVARAGIAERVLKAKAR